MKKGNIANQKPTVIVCGLTVGPEIEPHWEELRRQTDLVIMEESSTEALEEMIQDASVIIVRGTRVTSKTLEKAGNLKGIVTWGVGYDNIDINAANYRGLPVITLPVFLASMAEAVFCFLFLITKKYDRLNQLIRHGSRPALHDRSQALEGKVLGCVGLGRIGSKVARIALALDMQILVYDPYLLEAVIDNQSLPLVSLEELLRQSDFVSLHAPATGENRHMINRETIAMMKPNAYLINIARGSLVDESALYEALVNGKISGAALDVFETEPVTPDNPLLTLENVWATPHYLGATWEGLAQVAQAAQDAALKLTRGEPPDYHLINPEIYGDNL